MTPLRYEVVFHPDAQADALAAARFIARKSPGNAARWYDGLERALKTLAYFPHRCAIAPETQHLGFELRHYIYKSYRIIFTVEEARRTVRVLHVRHGAMRALGEVGSETDDA